MSSIFVCFCIFDTEFEYSKTSNIGNLPVENVIQFNTISFNQLSKLIKLICSNYSNCFGHFQIPIFNSPNSQITTNSLNRLSFKYGKHSLLSNRCWTSKPLIKFWWAWRAWPRVTISKFIWEKIWRQV
jgi:hypothetical protein